MCTEEPLNNTIFIAVDEHSMTDMPSHHPPHAAVHAEGALCSVGCTDGIAQLAMGTQERVLICAGTKDTTTACSQHQCE